MVDLYMGHKISAGQRAMHSVTLSCCL